MAMSVTEYGLVKNDDGSMCFTIRPDDTPFPGVCSLALEESTTNYIDFFNSSPELLFTHGSGDQPVVEINEVVNIDGFVKTWHIKITASGTASGWDCRLAYWNVTATENETWASSEYVKFLRLEGVTFKSWLAATDASDTWLDSTAYSVGETIPWQRQILQITTPAGTEKIRHVLWIYDIDAGDEIEFYVTYVQLEKKEFATSFVNGSRPESKFRFLFPESPINWVVAFWIKPMYYPSSTPEHYAFQLYKSSDDRYNLKLHTSDDRMIFEYYDGTSVYYVGSPSGVFPALNEWSFVVYWFDAPTAKIYLNGEKVAEGELSNYGTSDYTFQWFQDQGTLKLSGLISNFCIGKAKDSSGNLVWTDSYIQEVYNARAPFAK